MRVLFTFPYDPECPATLQDINRCNPLSALFAPYLIVPSRTFDGARNERQLISVLDVFKLGQEGKGLLTAHGRLVEMEIKVRHQVGPLL